MTGRVSSGPSIVCPIKLFDRIEGAIQDIAAAINDAPSAIEKAEAAGKMHGVVSVLLQCVAYDDGNPDCRLCREFSKLRDKTATLVEQTARLI